MSVFKKLKGTFQHAQQDLVDGLRALTSLDNNSRYDPLHSLKAREVSLDTGADLLHCYQKNWSSIETETRESAKKAEEASALLTPYLKKWEKHAESVSHLEQEVKNIPSILAMLTQLHTLLDGLSQSFKQAGRGLDILEDLCEEQEFHRRCLEEQKKLAMYKALKEGDAEKVKVELAQAHAKKMVDLEAAKRKNLKERADVFTSAFQNDLEFYRTHGHPGKLPVELPKVASLSEITLDQDKQALDSFLGPSGETEGREGSLEVSGEGSYIEDDYTNDFSVKQDMDFLEDSNHQGSLAIDASLSDDADDRIAGIDPDDRIAGIDSDDRIVGIDSDDRIVGIDPNDRIVGIDPDDRIAGTDPDDRIAGTDPDDRIAGTDPDDRIAGTDPDDSIAGTDPDDRIAGTDPEGIAISDQSAYSPEQNHTEDAGRTEPENINSSDITQVPAKDIVGKDIPLNHQERDNGIETVAALSQNLDIAAT